MSSKLRIPRANRKKKRKEVESDGGVVSNALRRVPDPTSEVPTNLKEIRDIRKSRLENPAGVCECMYCFVYK